MKRLVLIGVALVALLSSTLGSLPVQAVTPAPGFAAPTPTPTANPVSDGQDEINPLTGLPVEDPSLLSLPPALVSVTNFPVSARPQTGLSTAPIVFETYIGYGMTRYLALFYGSYAEGQTSAADQAAQDAAMIGPIRSGRVAYEDIRALYDGFIVMSGAYIKVAQQLNQTTTVWNHDPDNVNGAGITMEKLQAAAEAQKEARPHDPALSGMKFNLAAPQNGQEANRLWLMYNYYNQVEWTYDAASGAYLRAQDKADGSGKFYPTTDKLTGEQLAFENVVVLFANHKAVAPSVIDIEMLYVKDAPALLFRDGQVYEATWNTRAPIGPIQLKDAEGNPIAYKPGSTWFEIVNRWSSTKELEPGSWKVRFVNP